jgi:hypothetical protein
MTRPSRWHGVGPARRSSALLLHRVAAGTPTASAAFSISSATSSGCEMRFDGWCSTHTEVTAMAGRAVAALPPHSGCPGAVRATRRLLGRPPRGLRRSLFRPAPRVRTQLQARGHRPPGADAPRPRARLQPHRRQHLPGRDDPPVSSSPSVRCPDTHATGRRSAACTCAAPPPTPAAV